MNIFVQYGQPSATNYSQRGDFSSFFLSHFVRSKTGELGSSASGRAINSLQNPIHGYAYEFHFSEPFLSEECILKFSQCTAYIEGYHSEYIDKPPIFYSQNVATITSYQNMYNTYIYVSV